MQQIAEKRLAGVSMPSLDRRLILWLLCLRLILHLHHDLDSLHLFQVHRPLVRTFSCPQKITPRTRSQRLFNPVNVVPVPKRGALGVVPASTLRAIENVFTLEYLNGIS